MKVLAITLFWVWFMAVSIVFYAQNKQQQQHKDMETGYNARFHELVDEGWSEHAAHIIAGVETDIYDESDTAEYAEYVAYMED